MRLEAKNISFKYSSNGKSILKDVSMHIDEGERVGIVGPSGYGKSTLAKLMAGYLTPMSGSVLLDGKPLRGKGVCPVQLIYQHPEKAINPRWKMGRVLEESGFMNEELLSRLGIEKQWLTRFPRELSGGELQRFCVARSLFEGTRFLIADEMSTMLDVITQAQLWNVVLNEAEKRNMGLIVVTHNQHLAERVCTRIIDLSLINNEVHSQSEIAEVCL
ncbi:MAG: ATP-binding cassette domain-containing protein [Clostridiales bacterium]|jgi:peptide/nickel transport system ATP-binding protein|nr:ATP-binding cassette domain-containing protein [Clostridiales bacterium]